MKNLLVSVLPYFIASWLLKPSKEKQKLDSEAKKLNIYHMYKALEDSSNVRRMYFAIIQAFVSDITSGQGMLSSGNLKKVQNLIDSINSVPRNKDFEGFIPFRFLVSEFDGFGDILKVSQINELNDWYFANMHKISHRWQAIKIENDISKIQVPAQSKIQQNSDADIKEDTPENEPVLD